MPASVSAYNREIAELFVAYRNAEDILDMLSSRHPFIKWELNAIELTIQRLLKMGLHKVVNLSQKFACDFGAKGVLELSRPEIDYIVSAGIDEGLQIRLV
jgi:hypothetical protein